MRFEWQDEEMGLDHLVHVDVMVVSNLGHCFGGVRGMFDPFKFPNFYIIVTFRVFDVHDFGTSR